MKKNIFKTIIAAAAAVVMALAVPAMVPSAATAVQAAGNTYTVSVAKGYLALRTHPSYNESNEIGELYSGDTVEVSEYTNNTYWYVYSSKYGRYGYVNKNYLIGGGSSSVSSDTMTVSVAKGYLALRTAAAYDSRNEIGELYTGDTVQVSDRSGSTYWWVYSPKYGKYGYVNKNYLVGGGSYSSTSDTMTVSVAKGYLALRTAAAYDSRNEIGELYTGDTVQVSDRSGSTYWWVYSPKYNRYGYVNKNYLVGGGSSSSSSSSTSFYRTVRVQTGYLALRNARAYDESNEIGAMYTGETVEVLDTSYGKYWYVYSPKLGLRGYCNSDYLY